MKDIRAAIRNSMAIGTVFCALTGSVAWAQSPGEQPPISIVQPAFNSMQAGATVTVSVHFGPKAVTSTFHAQIDGTDITNLFAAGGSCASSGQCDMQAVLPGADLLSGTNIVTVGVDGPNESAAVDRTSFQFTGPSAQGGPVSMMIPAVSVQSVKLPDGASETDLNSYQILVGPGPGFAQRIYTAQGLTCSAGINSMQVLVLQSQTLAPESKVGTSSKPGQDCLGNAAALDTFLKSVPKGDIVIMNSFLGTMPNLDTTAIGGGKYAQAYDYNAIGVAGAKAGSAYESFQPNTSHTPRLGRDHLPPLVGSLMLDTAQRYFFVPSSYPVVKVTPGEMSEDQCASVEYGGLTHRNCRTSGSAGGFWIVAIDRLSGHVTDAYTLETNSNDAAKARQAINDLAYLLSVYYKSNDLLILTTFGTPIGANAPVTAGLYNAIIALGGNAFRLPQLTNGTSSYVLITSSDPDYVSRHYPVQIFSTAGKDDGPTRVQLAKNRLNQYVVNASAQDQKQTGSQPFGFEWSQVLFQQPQDWPQWTPAQQKAYLDLTAASNHYPEVSTTLGCVPGTCQPIRSYYGDGIGAVGSSPNFLRIPFLRLAYYPNPDYLEPDFNVVTTQLAHEQAYVGNVYQVYAQFAALAAGTDTNVKAQLSNVADAIDKSLYDSNPNAAISVRQLNQASAVAGLFAILPGVGPAAGAVSAAFNAAAAFTPEGDTPIPDQYAFTLAQLTNKTTTIGVDMSASISTAFAGAVQDWGKLSIIGPGVGGSVAPWKMCYGCNGSNVPVNGLPMFALSAKQRFYEQLLPLVYSSDVFVGKPGNDPTKLQRVGFISSSGGIFEICFAPYKNAPAQAFWSYPSINIPSTWDIFIITQTKKRRDLGATFDRLSFPSSALLEQLFGAPSYEPGSGPTPIYKLSGGAGFTQDNLMPTQIGGYLIRREGYAPGGTSSKCTSPW